MSMGLSLRIENETHLPDGGPMGITVSGKRNLDIGRDTHLDWTLPDPTRYISSRHCEVRYKEGGYWLHDVSTNGTFLNGGTHRMQAPHRLRTGDRFTIGHYIIAVMLEEEQTEAQSAATAPPQTPDYQALWADEHVLAAPIERAELKGGRDAAAPIHPDFLDWAADVPDPFTPPLSSPLPAPSFVPDRAAEAQSGALGAMSTLPEQ